MEEKKSTQILDSDASSESNQRLQPGATLANRYLIKGVLGMGGMGAVYCAGDMHFPNVEKLVAVKEMINQAPDPLVRQTIVRNFEREANLLAALEHRAIPRIYDYFSLNERSYLILEYINGQNLEAIVYETDDFLEEERVIIWGIELCEVLDYLHSHQPEAIVFRDMKPSNIMVNTQGHVVLVDFGIARRFQVGQRGTMIGTEGYSPPEQYRGEASPQADIYSLGATLHHVLTRQDPRLEPPFSFAERQIRHINTHVSPELEMVVNKALQYNPADRFASAREMRQALVVAAQKSGALERLAPSGDKYSPAAQPQWRESELKPVWSFRCEDEIRGTPLCLNGVVYCGCYDNNLYALNAKTGAFAWKYPSDGGIVSRPAAYDGSLFVGSEDHRLHVVFARTGKVNWTYFTKGPVRSSPVIAEGHVIIGSDDGFLHAINTATGRAAWKVDTGAQVRSTPLVYQDHVYTGNEAGDFLCLDFSGKVKWRFRARRAITSSAIVFNDVLYFGSVDATLYAVDVGTGWAIWRYKMGRPSITTPCAAAGKIFTGAADGVIYCIDASSSKEIWRFNTKNQVTGSPIVHRDALYCASVDGNLYSLEYTNGRLRWKFTSQGPITGTPAAADDMIYVGSTDHMLYALLA